jgi:hypothetical protein
MPASAGTARDAAANRLIVSLFMNTRQAVAGRTKWARTCAGRSAAPKLFRHPHPAIYRVVAAQAGVTP